MIRKITQTGFLIFLTSISVFGQELFIPAKPDNVSEKDYQHGLEILKNSYQQVVESNHNVIANDHWNFATAYFILGQPKEMIYDFLFKSKSSNKNFFCKSVEVYNNNRPIENTGFYKLIGEDYRELISDCSVLTEEEEFDVNEYIKTNKYDKELIYALNDLRTEDQKLRSGKDKDLEKQNKFDETNLLKAEEIIKKYGYPGIDMVGKNFASVIFLVIQHSDLEHQEKYLPLIAKTVSENQLGKFALRLLLDRIYTKKTGQQIFGSQVGVDFSDKKTIEDVKQKYNL